MSRPSALADKLYFLAFKKGMNLICTVAGPFVDPEDALDARVFHPDCERLVVVSTELVFYEEPAYD